MKIQPFIEIQIIDKHENLASQCRIQDIIGFFQQAIFECFLKLFKKPDLKTLFFYL